MLSQGDNFCYPLLKFQRGVLLLVCFANSLIYLASLLACLLAIFSLLSMWHFTFLFLLFLWMQKLMWCESDFIEPGLTKAQIKGLSAGPLVKTRSSVGRKQFL